MESQSHPPAVVRRVHARFEPTAAIATCRVEEVMSMPIEQLASVAWPLLTNAQRSSSMKDVYFTPPIRVSASPRATEGAFAAGIQSCVAELKENLSQTDCSEMPLSTAQLRAAAFAYFIASSPPPLEVLQASAPCASGGAFGSVTQGTEAVSHHKLKGGHTLSPPVLSLSQDVFEFDVQSLGDGSERETRETMSCGVSSGTLFHTSRPYADASAAASPLERASEAEAGASPTSTAAAPTRAAVIKVDSNNHGDTGAVESLGGAATSSEEQTRCDDYSNPPTAAATMVTAEKGRQAVARASRNSAVNCGNDILSDRRSYERKTRRSLAEHVDTQWESIMANVLISDVGESCSRSGLPSLSAASSSWPPSAGASALLRQKILRTAVMLCRRAPTCAEAGHSFASLLRHSLRAVSATDAIRGADGSAISAPALHPPSSSACRRQRSPLTSAQKRGPVQPIEKRETRGLVKQSLSLAAAPNQPQHTSVAQQQAALWVELVLPLLHLVPLVQWPQDTLAELGQVLETVTATAPAKLVALARQQYQQQLRSRRARGGGHAAVYQRPSQGRRGGAAVSATAAETTAPAVMSGGGAEEVLNFSIRVPFEIGLPVPPLMTETRLSDLVPDLAGAASRNLNPRRSGNGEASLTEPAAQLGSTSEGGASTGNRYPSYPSSAFHEASDVHDNDDHTGATAITEEMSVANEEEGGSEDESAYTDAEGEYAYDAGSAASTTASESSHSRTSRASAPNVSESSHNDEDADDADHAGGVGDGLLFSSAQGDFDALPCRRRCTQMVELCLPSATRVSVRITDAVQWDRALRGRDVLLLPLESDASSAERTPSALAETSTSGTSPGGAEALKTSLPSAAIGRGPKKDTRLPVSLQSVREENGSGILTYAGPCRVVIPSLPQDPVYMLPGEVCAQVQLTLDTRWSNEWAVALSSAQRAVAERLLAFMERRVHVSGDQQQVQQRRGRVASSLLLRGGLKGVTGGGASVPGGSQASMADGGSGGSQAPVVMMTTAASAGAAASATSTAASMADPFSQALYEMPVAALRARVRCHSVHADSVRAVLLVIAHALLQDRTGYLHGDPLTWHSPTWSDAVRRVSLASTTVGGTNSGEQALEVALFILRNIASGLTASTVPSAQVVDAAIDLFSIPGLTVADVKVALEDRRQLGSTMWVVVDLLTKCSATWRAPRHVALVSEAVRRLLLLGCTGAAALFQNHQAHSSSHRTTVATSVGGPTGASALASTSGSAACPSLPTPTAAFGHYLSVVSGCGRATEANLRRGVHALLAQLFGLLRALLHRVQSTQAAPHRFLLEPWEYGAFAVFTVSLMSTPMDAADVHVCAPHFAEVVTGLLPSFTSLSRTESLMLTSETAEQEFLVEVAKCVRGRLPSVSLFNGGSGCADGSGSAELGESETPASREPRILRRYQETASGNTVTSISSMPSVLGDGGGLWDIPQSSASASWTPGHVRVELWNGMSSGFFIGLASTDVPIADCTPEADFNGIYFIGDGTVQYGDVTRRQRRLPHWRAGDVVELNFVFARGGWDVVMALNGLSLTRLKLPRRDFRLVATNVRTGEYVPGHGHVHVLSVTPVHSRGGKDSGAARRRSVGGMGEHAPSSDSSSPLSLASAPADVRLSPFTRLTLFGVSMLLELVLHHLVLRSSRHARAVAAVAPGTSAGQGEGISLVQACTVPLQHSVQQLVRLLHELGSTDSSSAGVVEDGAMYHVKRTAARHVSNAMLLDLVVTLSISVPALPALLATHIDVLTAVAECTAVARKTRSVALSALYNAISQRSAAGSCDAASAHLSSVAAATGAATAASAPVSSSAVRRLWTACHQLASVTPGYQPRFSSASVPSSCVTVLAGGRRIEHNQVGTSIGPSGSGGAVSSNVRSMSYACNPIDLEDPHTPDIVRVSVRLQRGFQCETLGRYYYFGLAEINPPPMTTSLDGNGELTLYPGERSKQRRVYYISDYLTEVPGAAVQRWDMKRAESYLNPDTGIVFGSGDVMTAVVYVKERCISFERNGLPLNILHRGIPSSVRHIFPFVELYNRDSRAKWMYPPDEAVVSARYTMRAMLLSWTPLVLPLVKEHLSVTASAVSGTPARDVTLGVLGADGDEMQMVYVAPPQLDQPGGCTMSVRVERFEGGMVVVSDEAGSIQRVCGAALEPDSTKEAYSLPASAVVRGCVQACVPELAALAAECLAGLKRTSPTPLVASLRSLSCAEDNGADGSPQCVTLVHPATLLRTLRLIFSLHSTLPGKGGNANSGGSNFLSDTCVGASSGDLSRPASGAPTTPLLTTLPMVADKAIHALLPLLEEVLPASQLNLPPHVLLRESWNELWCNPHLRERLLLRVPQVSASDLDATVTAEEEAAVSAYTEPAGTTALTSVKRFEDRLVGHRRRGDALLCPTCGNRWSACTARHSAPSSWCDLLDRVLRRLQEQQPRTDVHRASPYCGWYTEWTDAPLAAADARGLPPGSSAAATAAATVTSVGDEVLAGDEDHHSPTSAQPSDETLWEDAEDEEGDEASEATVADGHGESVVEDAEESSSVDVAALQHDYSAASGAEETTIERSEPTRVEDSDEDEDEEDGEDEEASEMAIAAVISAAPESSAGAAADGGKDVEAPMTITIRRRQWCHGEEDGHVLVEGFGETKEASFTFAGYLISSAVLRGRMEFDRIDLPDGDGADGSTSQEWACSMCTFINEPSAVRCAICSNARPGASWTCPMCSFAYNTLAAPTCVTCGCMRPSSVRRQEPTGLSCYCVVCHQREHVRDFHALRHRHFCCSCARVTRWLPKDTFSTTIEARLTGDGATLEFQWALDGSKIICFGLHTSAYNADVLWELVEAAAAEVGSCAAAEVGRYVSPISERPLTSHLAKPPERRTSSAAVKPCTVGAIVHYASAIVLRYAALLPPSQLSQPDFLRRIHVCSTDWLDSWSQFPASTVTPIFFRCLQMLQDGIREPALVSTIASVALALIRQQPLDLAAEKDALLYALCLNVVRFGDTEQRKASYGCLSALMEDNACACLNVQPLVPVLSMEPLVEGQQRATVLALLHHASMQTTSAIAKASACMVRTVVAMEQRRPLPPMLGKPFPHVVALTETRLNEAGELLVGQVRGSVGVAPTKGGKFYYEVEVPPDFADRSRTVVMGWGTREHERIASAQHVGSDLHSWGYNCREHLRLMMTEQAMPVPRRPSPGDIIGSMMDLETMMVCWTINGQEISWVSVPAQGDGEEIYPYVSASVEPHSLKIRLGNTQFKPAGYEDYSPPGDRQLWDSDDEKCDDGSDAQVGAAAPVPQTYQFYQQLSRALEEASITSLKESSVLPLLDAARAHSVLRQYPLLMEVAGPPSRGGHEGRMAEPLNIHGLLVYIQQLRSVQELTIIVARHLWLIEKSLYLMSCYRKATDLLFSSGRWTIFELQPGGRPKYHGGHALRVLVSLRKANKVRAEADALWMAEHPALLPSASSTLSPLPSPSRQRSHADAANTLFATALLPVEGNGQTSDASEAPPPSAEESLAAHAHNVRDNDDDDGTDNDIGDFVGAVEGEDEDAEEDGGNVLSVHPGDSGSDRRSGLRDVCGDASALSPEERRLRCSVTGQLFTQLEKTRVYQRARMFAVQLEGTLALDAGGVTRTIMSMIGDEVSYRFIGGVRVDPLLPLFRLCSHSTIFTVVPNMAALYASEAANDGAEGSVMRRMFEWLGKIMGNMVLCGTLKASFDFPQMLWKTLTFQEDTITLADYAYDIDDNIIAALEDEGFVLSDDFFASLPEHVRASPAFRRSLQGGGAGATDSAAAPLTARPLRPYACMTPEMSMHDMSHLVLEELEEMAASVEDAEVSRRRALTQEALLHQYDPAFLAIRAGLTSVVPATSLRTVRWEDLRARVCGTGAASSEHVIAELDMSPLSPSMRAMLTKVLNGFTESQLGRFLVFCSGQSRIPLPEKVLVECGDEPGRLPTAHTCSPISLLLQPCTTAADLQRSLEACLTHAAEFGFV